MFRLQLLRYHYGQSFYHYHHPILKLAELLLVCLLSSSAAVSWNLLLLTFLLGGLALALPWHCWWRVLLVELLFFTLLTAVAAWSFLRQMPSTMAWTQALELSLPLNCISLQTLLFVRHTETLQLLGQLQRFGKQRYVMRLLLISALTLLIFPLIFEQFHRRLRLFALRGGCWWPWWQSLPLLLTALLDDVQQHSDRLSEALMLRAEPHNWSFSEHQRLGRAELLLFFLAVGLMIASWVLLRS